MADFIINVTDIEELQMTENKHELDKIFSKAKTTIIGGEKVILIRTKPGGESWKFDEITAEDALDDYKKQVYKYL